MFHALMRCCALRIVPERSSAVEEERRGKPALRFAEEPYIRYNEPHECSKK